MNQKCLFLDRDGVINIDYGYVHKIKDFHFIEGIFDIANKAIGQGYIIIVITNQSGIGRGLFSAEQFKTITEWMVEQFRKQDILITDVYYSPFHPTHGVGKYKKVDNTRKPSPGMIIKAAKDFNIDLKKSIFVGDKLSDMEAGFSAGVRTNILFDSKRESSQNNYYQISTLNQIELYL